MQKSLLFVSTVALLVSTNSAHRVLISSVDAVDDSATWKASRVALNNQGFDLFKGNDPPNDAAAVETFVTRVINSIPEGKGKTFADLPGTLDLNDFTGYKGFLEYLKLHLAPKVAKKAVWHSCTFTGPAGSELAAEIPTQSCTECKGALFEALFSQVMPNAFTATKSDNGRMCYCSVEEGDAGEPTVMGFPIGISTCNKAYCWQTYADLYNSQVSTRKLHVDNINNWKTSCPKCSAGEDSCAQGVNVQAKSVFLSPEELEDLKKKADKGDGAAQDQLDAIRRAGVVFTVEDDTDNHDELKPSDRAEVIVVTKEEARRHEECRKRGIEPCTQDAIDQAIEIEIAAEHARIAAEEAGKKCERHGLPNPCDPDELAKLLGLCSTAGIPEPKCTHAELERVKKAKEHEDRLKEEAQKVKDEQDRLNKECRKRGVEPCSQQGITDAIEADIAAEEARISAGEECARHDLPNPCDPHDLAKLLGQCATAGIPEEKCTYAALDATKKAEVNEARIEELEVIDIVEAAVKEGSQVECVKYGLPEDCTLGEREMHRAIRTAYPSWPTQKPACKDEEQLDNQMSAKCRKCLLMGRCRRKGHCMKNCARTCDSKYGEKRGHSECHNAIERVKEKCQKRLNAEQKKGCFGGNNGKRHSDVAVLPGLDTWITVPELCDASLPASVANEDDQFYFEEPWEQRTDYKDGIPDRDQMPEGMTKCDFVAR